MAPGAFSFWAGFCRRKIVPGGRAVSTAEQAKRRKEANELPSGFQETMRSDSQGSGRRVSRDNVSTRVSGENDWSDVAAADVWFLRPELPKKEVPGA